MTSNLGITNDMLTTGGQEAVVVPTDKGHLVQTAGVRSSFDARGHESNATDGLNDDGLIDPTDDDFANLQRVPVKMPITAYLICFVEFAERASYYGCLQVFSNFVRAPLPVGGNGAGAPPKGTQQNAGALGLGTPVASAVSDSFKFLAYALPLIAAYIADTRWGRFKMICIGVAVGALAHVIMVISAIPSVIQGGHAVGPFLLSVYILAVGAAMFKPNVAPILLDQNPLRKPHVLTLPSGERVIADPEATNESIMLWFYLLINIGGFFGTPTAYLAKDVGFWASFLLPGIIYFLLPALLWYLSSRLVKQPPGGSDLTNIFRVLGIAIKQNGIMKIFSKGFLNAAKPSHLAAAGSTRVVPWDDQYVDDITRTFQACGIFLFFPIFFINDGGLGAAANAQSAAMITDGVPNDLINNINPLAIIIFIPIMNHGVYPLLRKMRIRWGPISRITFGFLLCSIGSVGWAIIQVYVYKQSPCGNYASTCVDADGVTLVAPITFWYTAIPTAVTALAEVFCNVTAYGVAYSRSPPNMKSLVMAINLFMTAISSAISLGTAGAIQDPNIVWVFATPSIIGFLSAGIFWFIYKDLDKEEYVVHRYDDSPEARLSRHAALTEESSIGDSKTTPINDPMSAEKPHTTTKSATTHEVSEK